MILALPDALRDELAALLPPEALLTDPSDNLAYGYDNSRHRGEASAVVLPTSVDQVHRIVRACRAHRFPLIARGRGTNTTGATVPVSGGLVLSTERLNRVLRIDPDNRLAVVQPGVLNGELQRALAPMGFFWAPDPTSADYASIGGNLACNAGGPRAVKYGACRENVLALEAVTGAGERIRVGNPTTKGATGYDLTRLLVGSEGTLAVITEATLKLTPKPDAVGSLRALYRDVPAAVRAVCRVMAQPVVPSAVEFMDGAALELARATDTSLPEAGALLMVECDGPARTIAGSLAALRAALGGEGAISIEQAEDDARRDALWAARKALSPALRRIAPGKINEDVVVPVARLPELCAGIARIAEDTGVRIVNFGHAGNGNIHVNLLYQPDQADQAAAAQRALEGVFDLVLSLDGTLSGEHGIGLDKRAWIPRAIPPESLALMRGIKALFDPDGILNPGKLLPDP